MIICPPSPQGEGFFCRAIFKKLGFSSQRSPSAAPDSRTQSRPRGTPMKSARGVRSTTEGEIFKGTDGACADPGTQNFPCHGAQNGSAASQFNPTGFHVTRSLLWYFLGLQESTVSFSSLRPPSSFSCKHPLADIDNPRNFGYAIHVTKVLNYVIITNAYRKE